MVKVITYGTYDLLHHGHIKLLQRAKALGDYLIVGVTADDYDKSRGKINGQQSLMERIEAVKATGLADEIVVEEYEGQKIDDIQRMDVDVFAIGSDWEGKFDYLKEYCKVVYLPRTEGVSSSELRSQTRKIKLGLVGESEILIKFARECAYSNGAEVAAIFSKDRELVDRYFVDLRHAWDSFDDFLEYVDALYIISHPSLHYSQVKQALGKGKHVLCESPIALDPKQVEELLELARQKGCILMDAMKTAYSVAYYRLLLMVKSGVIGKVISVDATCTSQRNVDMSDSNFIAQSWNSISDWGPTAMLPVFQLLGTDYRKKTIVTKYADKEAAFDLFTKVDFIFDEAVASIKVGKGVKSEGELVVTGEKGYVYVPAPWWKMDYFEVRFENPEHNKRYFYQLDGEGLRYEVVAFVKSIVSGHNGGYVSSNVSDAISRVLCDYYAGIDLVEI